MPNTLSEPVLGRCVAKSPNLDVPLTSGGLQTTRLAAISRSTFAFCSGPSVFRMECSPSQQLSGSSGEVGERHDDASPDYLLPNAPYWMDVCLDLQHSTHRAEVTSLAASEDRFASIDCNGTSIISISAGSGESSSFALQPGSLTNGESGWAGVALQYGNTSAVATARQYYRDISIYDRDILVSSIHTPLEPAAISFVGPDGGSIAIAEGAALAMYDVRIAQQSSCSFRKMASPSELLALDCSSDGNSIAVAGVDRTVHVFDTRSQTFRERWPACLKYECAGLKLSRKNVGMVYVCGVDNEFAYGAWCSSAAKTFRGHESLMLSGANAKSPRRAHGFRGDARIVGIDIFDDDSGEVVGAMSEAGAFYVVEV